MTQLPPLKAIDNLANYLNILGRILKPISTQGCLFSIALAIALFANSQILLADPGKKLSIDSPFRTGNLISSPAYERDYDMSKALNIFENSNDPQSYDPLTLSTLRQLRDDASPKFGPDDIDVGKANRAVEKGLAIQIARNFSVLMNGSELRSTYRSILNTIQSVQDTFKLSLQRNDKGVVLSQNKKGKKILELSLEMSVKQGFDPQIQIGENVRFRYDFVASRPMLEYGFRF